MTADPLTQVLRLVAEGRLTADEAAPILAALDARAPEGARGDRSSAEPGGGSAPSGSTEGRPPTGPSSIRIEIQEAGRRVVDLRLPIAVGRLALDRVPGLSGDQVERVRDAMRSGVRGPVVVIEDGDDAVRIILE
jgi:hypothetical protein